MVCTHTHRHTSVHKTHPMAPIYYISHHCKLLRTNKQTTTSGIIIMWRKMLDTGMESEREKRRKHEKDWWLFGCCCCWCCFVGTETISITKITHSLYVCLFLASVTIHAWLYTRIVCSCFIKYQTGILCLAYCCGYSRESVNVADSSLDVISLLWFIFRH